MKFNNEIINTLTSEDCQWWKISNRDLLSLFCDTITEEDANLLCKKQLAGADVMMSNRNRAMLFAGMELGSRIFGDNHNYIRDQYDIIPFIRHLATESVEHILLITLNFRNCIIHIRNIGTSGNDYVSYDMSKIVELSQNDMSKNIIICHNHPFDDYAKPSKLDNDSNKRLEKYLAKYNIELFDDVIISQCSMYSHKTGLNIVFNDYGRVVKQDLKNYALDAKSRRQNGG